jgi:hypothetical protein
MIEPLLVYCLRVINCISRFAVIPARKEALLQISSMSNVLAAECITTIQVGGWAATQFPQEPAGL